MARSDVALDTTRLAPVFFDPDEIPEGELVPYAIVELDGNGTLASRARSLWETSLHDMPDALLVLDRGAHQSGSVSLYWGFGVTTSNPTYEGHTTAILMREATAVLPLSMNAAGMVTVIRDESAIHGIQEGDTILSIDGRQVSTREGAEFRSEHVIGRLALVPGQDVRVIGIRPGVGRVEGTVKAVSNPKTFRAQPSRIDVSAYRLVIQFDDNGVPYAKLKRGFFEQDPYGASAN